MIRQRHLPCPDCDSSDALCLYDDHTYCFSCKKHRRLPLGEDISAWPSKKDLTSGQNRVSLYLEGRESDTSGETQQQQDKYFSSTPLKFGRSLLYNKESNTIGIPKGGKGTNTMVNQSMYNNNSNSDSNPKVNPKYNLQYIGWRGLSIDTMKSYGIQCRVDNDTGQPISFVFPYGEDARKVRLIDKKDFFAEGAMKDAALFGMDKFSPAQGMSVTITEGEVDAASVFQMLGSKYPAVSVRGASSARADCARAFKWLNSFDKIYLCFDNDEPGQRACKEVATLFDINKVYHVEMGGGHKDANDYLSKGNTKAFTNVWWNAKRFIPKGIIADYVQIEDTLKQVDAQTLGEYPFPTLQSITYGIRSGELVLFTAQEKVGKTEVLRAIEYHLLKTTDHNIGVIHLEESEKRSVQGLIGYELSTPVHLPDCNVSLDDQIKAYKDLTKRDGRLHFYQHFGSDDPDSILDVIRYLVGVCHCKFIFLDHITMLVTGFEGDDERKKLDYISTRLAMLTRELDFTLFLVSHVNDDGKTRGSRNISKVADLIIHLDRNTEGETIAERNKTNLLVRGNRFAGTSGPAGTLWFDQKSYTLSELTEAKAELIEVPF